jgi:hypothetical protein
VRNQGGGDGGVSLGLGEGVKEVGTVGGAPLRPQRACLRARKSWRARWLSVPRPKFTKWAANTSVAVAEHRAMGKSMPKNAWRVGAVV